MPALPTRPPCLRSARLHSTMSRALSLLTIPTVPQDVVSALNSNEGGMSAFESLLSVYEMVRGQHNHGACSHLITRFLSFSGKVHHEVRVREAKGRAHL